jgi:tetratricopeptide (TPR) repeat protein
MTAIRAAGGAGVLALVVAGGAVAQPARPGDPPATAREYRKSIRTYPFSDPNPIATMGRIYPYFRFDGYTDAGVDREWTVVELENAYLKVVVMPEVGGKIWTAIDKRTGKPFLYDNEVVKFRDIAMRGPWTSGGVEPNYGIIGHTPNCATPVDYVWHTNADGSASVTIGVLDLLTRTPWRLEVRLPRDAAYFTTRSFWYNATPIEQPYYTWMNAGIKAAGNLQLIYPGSNFIGHNGEVGAWPIRPEDGRDLSFYERNNFGSYKSYHVLGTRTDVFGAYWHDEDFGMARYSRRDDKPGKKIWIWGLSAQGMIWEKLLTDHSGQYVEVQSGRLFNQAAEGSSLTPFKHLGFAPHASDSWTEYWFPVRGTGGFVGANEFGALNVREEPGGLVVAFSPLQRVSDTLEVFDGERRVFTRDVLSEPMTPWTVATGVNVPRDRLRVRLPNHRLEYLCAPGEGAISRPLTAPPDFDWDSTYGRWLKGKELIRQREYAAARRSIEASLAVDRHFVPALVDLAQLQLRTFEYEAARTTARDALAIDTYDPGANYYYALANLELGRYDDARDGFEVAAVSAEYRVAAWNGLARLWLSRGRIDRAVAYAGRAVEAAPLALEAYQVLAVAHRLRGGRVAATRVLADLEAIAPLSHFARAERWLWSGDGRDRASLQSGIRNELPAQTYLELGAWYAGVARDEDAARVLQAAPSDAEVLYWRAYLASRSAESGARELLALADGADPRFVFPFRAESLPVLQWAASQSTSWRPKYYLALLYGSRGERARAGEWFDKCGDVPDFAPFYVARADARAARSPEAELADLERAATLDPAQWRIGRRLVERALADGRLEEARATAQAYYDRSPANYIFALVYAKTLLATARYDEAIALLARVSVLPYEGSTDGRRLYREAHLMRAVAEMTRGAWTAALASVDRARLWPENLGAGKPYPADVDERLEDWLTADCLARAGRAAESRAALERVVGSRAPRIGVDGFVTALALDRLGRADAARAELARADAGQPDAGLRSFGTQLFARGPAALPVGSTIDEEYRVLAAWSRVVAAEGH